MADQDRIGKLIERARAATGELRDAAREGRVIDFRKRDPLVAAIHDAFDELEALRASLGSETVTQELSAALRDWETAKRAFDAVRPCFSSNQLRELEAVERRLLAAIHQPASPGSVQWAREQIHQQLRDVRARLTATQEGEDYDRGVCDACNDAIEQFNTSPGSVSDQGWRDGKENDGK